MNETNTLSSTIHGKNWQFYLALVISALCLLIPAFYNHYPLFNPDDGTYIASGFKPEMPVDRPITYGLLIWLFSLNGFSAWLVVFTQAYVVSWLLFRILKNLSGSTTYILKSVLIIFLLSIGSSLSWIVSQVQPDLYTSIAYLCIVLILMDKESKRTNNMLYCLFFIAVATHLSHPNLMIASLLLLLFFRGVYADKANLRAKKIIYTLLVLSAGSMLTMMMPLSKSGHVFFMGSLLEKGVMKKYLDGNCAGNNNYKICQFKDVLPATADEFWWDTVASPLYKIGPRHIVKHEFHWIFRGVFSSPEYVKLYLEATLKQAGQQAVTFNIGDGNQPFHPGTNVNDKMVAYFPREINRFNNDIQNTEPLADFLVLPNKIFAVVVACGLLILVFAFVKWKRLSKEMKLLLIVCVPGILLNCLDCAAFGTINGRFGCKMIWLIPFCAMTFLVSPRPSPKEREILP